MSKLKEKLKRRKKQTAPKTRRPDSVSVPPAPEKTEARPAPKVTSFSNPLALENCVSIIFGRRGSGKTTLAQDLAAQFRRVIVFDPLCNMSLKGFSPVMDFDEMVASILKKPENFKMIFKPRDFQREFGILCQYLTSVPIDNTLFLVDEVALLCDTYHMNEDFHDLIRTCRHYKIGIIMTAQRPKDVNRTLTALCNHVFTFSQHEPVDVAYMRGFLGREADQIPALKDFSFLYWDTRTSRVVDYKK